VTKQRFAARLVVLVVTAMLAIGAAAMPAAAHAALLHTKPSDGAKLEAAPREILLEFNEHVSAPLQAIRVFNSAAERVDEGDAGSGPTPSMLRVGVREGLPDGPYIVTWRAVSADAHPIRGAFVFTVGNAAVPAESISIEELLGDENQTGFEVVATIGRWVLYLGVLLAAGGVAFLAFAHDRRQAERAVLTTVVLMAAIAAAVATVIEVPIQGALVTGLGAAALVDSTVLGQVLASTFGVAALVRLVGLALLLVGVVRMWRPWGSWLGIGGGLVALGSLVVAGHSITTEPRWLSVGSNYIHAVTGAIWFGGLVLLGLALRCRKAADDAFGGAMMVSRFSTLATVSVLVVVAAGTALAWTEVRALRALTSTAYGWTLVVKVVLVGAILAVGRYNNRRLVPAIMRSARGGAGGHPQRIDAWQTLTRAVRVEAIGIVVVLAVTAVLVNLPPARSAAGIGEVFSGYADLGSQHQVNLTVDPNEAGPNEFHLYLLTPSGQPADIGEQIMLRMELPEADIAPIERTPQVAGPGHYLHSGPELSIPGRWRIEVVVDVSKFEQLTAAFDVDVSGRSTS
jgi:copper transport protein